jgi:DNA mismatch repair protein MSH6
MCIEGFSFKGEMVWHFLHTDLSIPNPDLFSNQVFLAFDENYLIWLQVVKSVAQLDCVLSLAKASIGLGETTCRPKIVDSDEAMVKFVMLRHPCTVGRDDSDFISNDVSVGGDECRMILLTGPNM